MELVLNMKSFNAGNLDLKDAHVLVEALDYLSVLITNLCHFAQLKLLTLNQSLTLPHSLAVKVYLFLKV